MQSTADTFKTNEDAGSSSEDGIAIITSHSHISMKERIFWIILKLAALGAFIYFSVGLITQHRKFQVYHLRNSVINNDMVLPAMTFCNTNYYEDSLNETQPVKPFPTSCNQNTNASNFGSRKDQMYFNKACNIFLANGNFKSSFLGASLGFSFPEHFNLQRNKGPCYTLNRNKELKQETIPGLKTGLHMLLYMNESDIEKDPENIARNPILGDQRGGLVLSINDQDIYMSDVFGGGIPLPSGYHTLISLKKYVMKRKPAPFPSACVDDGKKKRSKTYQGKYNVKICISACFLYELYTKCGIWSKTSQVLLMQSKHPPVLQNLTASEKVRCGEQIVRDFDKTRCDCPTPCHEVFYDVKVMRKPWPPEWLTMKYIKLFAQALNKTENEISGEILRNLLKISIYFDDFTTTFIKEEEVFSYQSLISDVGGSMGLILGASVISIIEMAWFVIKFLKRIVQLRVKIAPDDKNKVEEIVSKG